MKLITFFLTLCLLASTSSFAAKPPTVQKLQKLQKQRVVLMPLRLGAEDKKLQGAMETALVEGLQDRYVVFSGENVQQKARAIFNKESQNAKGLCDETRCMQDIAIAFQAELIATADVTKVENGYFLAISIQNIFDNKVVYSKSMPCKNSDSFEVIEKLKELAGATTIKNTASIEVLKPVKEKVSINNTSTLHVTCFDNDIGAMVWINNKQRGACPAEIKVSDGINKLKVIKYIDKKHEGVFEEDIIIYPDTIKRIEIKLEKKLSIEGMRIEKEKLALVTKNAQEEAAQRILDLPKGIFTDKHNNLIWQDQEYSDEEKNHYDNDTEGGKVLNFTHAQQYCNELNYANFDDWYLPNKQILTKLYLKKALLENIGWNYKNMTKGGIYWSSSVIENDDTQASFVNFNTGLSSTEPISYTRYVRCVRDNK